MSEDPKLYFSFPDLRDDLHYYFVVSMAALCQGQCQNGGTCANVAGAPGCVCTAHYYGDKCQYCEYVSSCNHDDDDSVSTTGSDDYNYGQ